MNRIIKFRAKDENDKWQYSDFDAAGFWYGLSDGQLNRETLCQFTGCYSKESKEIFEGDLVQNFILPWREDNPIFRVSFLRGTFLLIPVSGEFDEREAPNNMPGAMTYFPNYFKIIGNIFDNPELLK